MSDVEEVRVVVVATPLVVAEVTALVLARGGRVLPSAGPASDTLSPREREVVGFIADGLTNDAIAARLYISVNSVKTYVRTAYRKMGVADRAHAMLWALAHGYGAGPTASPGVGRDDRRSAGDERAAE